MSGPSDDQARAERNARRWKIAGRVLAVVAGLTGLVVLGTYIVFMVALNSWADNK